MGRRALHASVEFIDIVCVSHHVGSHVDYTPEIFINSWGVNPTDTITANVSNITRHDYDPICSFHGFVLQSNHEHLRLKRIELKRICFEELLARICQDVRDDVTANVCATVNNYLGDALSNDSDSNDGWINIYGYY